MDKEESELIEKLSKYGDVFTLGTDYVFHLLMRVHKSTNGGVNAFDLINIHDIVVNAVSDRYPDIECHYVDNGIMLMILKPQIKESK